MEQRVIYWDTSAVLSALLQDTHTQVARGWLEPSAVHLVSSLTGSEFSCCIARLQRDGQLTNPLAEATIQAFEQGPWRRVAIDPDWNLFWPVSRRCWLRGADLWHLALALTLQQDLPTITLLTFDAALQTAVVAEGLVP